MISITFDIKQFTQAIDDIAKKQLPFAMSKAINAVADKAKGDLQREMERVFDRPTNFTKTSVYIKYSNKRNLMAEVGIKPIAAKYLYHQVFGGKRPYKKVEGAIKGAAHTSIPWALPSEGVGRDSGGNVSRATFGKILASIAGQQAAQVQAKRKRKPAVYWLAKHKGEAQPYGIMKKQGKRMQLALAFSRKTPKYKKRLPFAETIARTLQKNIQETFRIELQKAMASAK